MKSDAVNAQLAALPGLTTPELRARWRELFQKEPPHHHRQFLVARLSYRIQELAYGGLTPETLKRLEALGEELDGGNQTRRRMRTDGRPVVGTRFIREWHGKEYRVTVRHDGYEYDGRRYKSLTSIARAITGGSWNGWAFFGLRNARGRAG